MDETLEDRIIRRYPAPIAVPYRAMTEQDAPDAAFDRLLDVLEGLTSFLAATVASGYARSGLSIADCDRALHALSTGKLGTGELLGRMHDLLRHGGQALDAHLPYPLAAHLLPSGEPSPSMRALGTIAKLLDRPRGLDGGHEAPTEALRARSTLDAELAALDALTTWTLVRPLTVREDGEHALVERADLLMGDRRLRARPFEVAIAREELDARGAQLESTLALVSPERDRYLLLVPSALFPLRLGGRGERFPRHTERSSGGGLGRAPSVAHELGRDPHEERAVEAASAVERFVATPRARAVGDASTSDLPEVRIEQALHTASFVGRDAWLAELSGWIDAGSGYLLVLGGPGLGKSALLAELARREEARGGALLHMIKSHRSPSRFVPALLRQASHLGGQRIAESVSASDDDLRDALVRALSALDERTGRAVLILDALDELDGLDRRCAFLPPKLPDGARVILSCRPDAPLVESLRAQLVALEERTLSPLDPKDVEALLAAHVPEEHVGSSVRAAIARAGGNPLLVRRAIAALKRWAEAGATQPFDVASLPVTHDDLFGQVYAEIAEKDGTRFTTDEGRDKARILQLLAVAREPLGIEALTELLRRDGARRSLEDVRDRVREASAYLMDLGGERFVPWHRGLVDYLRARVLGEDGVRELEARFADWAAERSGTPYALRHRIDHLVASGRRDEAGHLLIDPSFLQGQLDAGLVYDLSRQLCAVEAPSELSTLLPRIGEILRRHAGFLHRHPGALFTVLHDAAYWHDAPEARLFYDPPPHREPVLSTWIARFGEHDRPWLRTLRPPEAPLDDALAAVLRAHDAAVDSLAFSPDGALLASSGRDGTARVFDAATGAPRLVVRASARGRVPVVVFEPGGEHLVTGGEDGSVRRWDLEGREVDRGPAHDAMVHAIAIAPDGSVTASGGRDRVLRVASESTVSTLATSGSIYSLAISPDGARIAAAVTISRLVVWNVREGRTELDVEVPYSIEAVSFLPDGSLVAAFADAVVRVYAPDGAVLEQVDIVEEQRLFALAISRDGRTACAGSSGRIWTWERGARRAAREGHASPVGALAFAPDGRLASGAVDGTVRLYRAAAEAHAPRVRGDRGRIACVAYSNDGQRLAIGGHDGVVQLWRADDPHDEQRLAGHSGSVLALAFSPDDRLLASASIDGTVRAWSRAGRTVALLRDHAAAVKAVAFTPDGGRLVTGSRDHTVRVSSLFGSRELWASEHDEGVVAVAASRDGRLVLALGAGGSLAAWTVDGRPVLRARLPLSAKACAMEVSADGARVAVELVDGTAGVWSHGEWTAAPRTELRELAGLVGPPPFRAHIAAGETRVVRAIDGGLVAAYPHELEHLVASPSGRAWAGWRRAHVHVIALVEPTPRGASPRHVG